MARAAPWPACAGAWGPLAVVANDSGPARSVVEALGRGRRARRGLRGGADYVAACQAFYDLVIEGRLAHRGQANSTRRLGSVGRRKLGESWAFGRAVSSADISALVAAAVAAHRAGRPHVVPRIIVG